MLGLQVAVQSGTTFVQQLHHILELELLGVLVLKDTLYGVSG